MRRYVLRRYEPASMMMEYAEGPWVEYTEAKAIIDNLKRALRSVCEDRAEHQRILDVIDEVSALLED